MAVLKLKGLRSHLIGIRSCDVEHLNLHLFVNALTELTLYPVKWDTGAPTNVALHNERMPQQLLEPLTSISNNAFRRPEQPEPSSLS